MNESSYAAVIVHYRDPESALQTVETLRAQTLPPHDIVIVDNSAKDHPIVPPSGVKYVAMAENGGYAAAVNAARTVVKNSDWVLILTQDARLRDDAVAQMVSAGHQMGADCVGPRLFYRSDNSRVFSSGGRFALGCRPVHDRTIPSPTDPVARTVQWVDGAIMLVKRAALDRLSWLDESYFLYFEEVDLCSRLGPGAVAVANHAIAFQEPGNFTAYLHLRNQILFWRRNGRKGRIVLATVLQASRSLGAVAVKRRGNIKSIVLGIYDGVIDRGGLPRAS